ncbi:MAG: HAD hydrolase-like protein, partial [Alphaproteobacteria bacterium]
LGVLEALGSAAHEAVMVGDSLNDVACARAAGVAVIVVTYGYTPVPPERLGADLTIARFAELPAALARLPRARPGPA